MTSWRGIESGMKLPLIHHGYQGKHKRGQIPRQRDDEPALRAVEKQETQEEQGGSPVSRAGISGGAAAAPSAGMMPETHGTPDADAIPDADAMPDTGTWSTGQPGQRPPSATHKPPDSSRSRP